MKAFRVPDTPRRWWLDPSPSPPLSIRALRLLPTMVALGLVLAGLAYRPGRPPSLPPAAHLGPLVFLSTDTLAGLAEAGHGEFWLRLPVVFSLPSRQGFSLMASPSRVGDPWGPPEHAALPPFLDQPESGPWAGSVRPGLIGEADRALARPPRRPAPPPLPAEAPPAPGVQWVLRDGLAGRAWVSAPQLPETLAARPPWQAEAMVDVDAEGFVESVLLVRPATDPLVNQALPRLLRGSRFESTGQPASGPVGVRSTGPAPETRNGR